MSDSQYIFKSKPGYAMMALFLTGTVLFAFLANLMWKAKWTFEGVSPEAGRIIIGVFLILFLAFALLCLTMLLAFRVFYFTQNQLIIKRPLLFYKREVFFADISNLAGEDAPIQISNNSILPYTIYNGSRLIILLNTGEKIRISSIEIWGYPQFAAKFHSIMRSGKH